MYAVLAEPHEFVRPPSCRALTRHESGPSVMPGRFSALPAIVAFIADRFVRTPSGPAEGSRIADRHLPLYRCTCHRRPEAKPALWRHQAEPSGPNTPREQCAAILPVRTLSVPGHPTLLPALSPATIRRLKCDNSQTATHTTQGLGTKFQLSGSGPPSLLSGSRLYAAMCHGWHGTCTADMYS